MNSKEIESLRALRNEWQGLHDSSFLRANTIIEDGRVILEEDRAKSAGYASAYSYCIMRLDMELHKLGVEL